MDIKKHVKGILKSKIFLGRYLERRLVDEQIGYRDVVLISAAEVELLKELVDVKEKVCTAYPSLQWVGISDTNFLGSIVPGTCLWTEIDNKPFGLYWFQIKSVKFSDQEFLVTLSCLRHISDAYLEKEPAAAKFVEQNLNTSDSKSSSIGNESFHDTVTDVIETIKNSFTPGNVVEFLKFLFAIVIAVVTGSTAFISFLGNFVLAFIREVNMLIKSSTPLCLGFLDFLSKIVGGFYILLGMFFKPSNYAPRDRTLVYQSPPIYSQHYRSKDFD